jgi:hypothetical protein
MTPEVNVLTYPNGAHMTVGATSPTVSFWMYKDLEFIFIVKRPS